MDLLLEKLGPISDPLQLRKLQEAINLPVEPSKEPLGASESERAKQLALLQLHSSAYSLQGQIIRARVLDIDRKKILIDTGIKIAKIAHSDITSECIVGTTRQDDALRKPGEVRVGDIVQVFLESVETPEGDMLVSGQQAAQERRFQAIWNELEQRMKQRDKVQGRVLNQLSGGYAVGVAGLVCFLPAQACHPSTASRIGQLQEFNITGMNKSRNNVVLRDANFAKLIGQQVRQGRAGPRFQEGSPAAAAARPGAKPRGQENPEKFKETVHELRALLAGKTRPQPQESS